MDPPLPSSPHGEASIWLALLGYYQARLAGCFTLMRVAFAGTPEFARVALEAILTAGFDVPLVLTQPDRPAGRGMQLQTSPVKQLALAHGIAVAQPERLKDPASHAPLLAAAPDVLVVAAYGLILPQAVLDIPRLGCLNIHASLLPRWRGAAPIQRAASRGIRAGTVQMTRRSPRSSA